MFPWPSKRFLILTDSSTFRSLGVSEATAMTDEEDGGYGDVFDKLGHDGERVSRSTIRPGGRGIE